MTRIGVYAAPGARPEEEGGAGAGARAQTEPAAGAGGVRRSDTVEKKPQELRVRIGAHVEIGANSTIDRGSWRDTAIGAHSKLDNLVHIAHNVVLGQHCLLAAQTAIAGSCSLGALTGWGLRCRHRRQLLLYNCVCVRARVTLNRVARVCRLMCASWSPPARPRAFPWALCSFV